MKAIYKNEIGTIWKLVQSQNVTRPLHPPKKKADQNTGE